MQVRPTTAVYTRNGPGDSIHEEELGDPSTLYCVFDCSFRAAANLLPRLFSLSHACVWPCTLLCWFSRLPDLPFVLPGKFGALLGSLMFKPAAAAWGVGPVLVICALISLAGAFRWGPGAPALQSCWVRAAVSLLAGDKTAVTAKRSTSNIT